MKTGLDFACSFDWLTELVYSPTFIKDVFFWWGGSYSHWNRLKVQVSLWGQRAAFRWVSTLLLYLPVSALPNSHIAFSIGFLVVTIQFIRFCLISSKLFQSLAPLLKMSTMMTEAAFCGHCHHNIFRLAIDNVHISVVFLKLWMTLSLAFRLLTYRVSRFVLF